MIGLKIFVYCFQLSYFLLAIVAARRRTKLAQ